MRRRYAISVKDGGRVAVYIQRVVRMYIHGQPYIRKS